MRERVSARASVSVNVRESVCASESVCVSVSVSVSVSESACERVCVIRDCSPWCIRGAAIESSAICIDWECLGTANIWHPHHHDSNQTIPSKLTLWH